jgi:hypothetical protein
MPLSPANQLAEQRRQIAAPRGRMILLARRVLPVTAPLDQAAPLEPFEPFGQDVGRDPLGRAQKSAKRRLLVEAEAPTRTCSFRPSCAPNALAMMSIRVY